MNAQTTIALIRNYYNLFNTGDRKGAIALLSDDVAHDINQGQREIGRQVFTDFFKRMDRCYREHLDDIVVFADASGERAAAEFVVNGTYLSTDEGLPAAKGQTYRLPCGAFFAIRDNRITRVSNYYNLTDWLRQIGA